MGKLISVIVPVYNREDYVLECLQSILEQSYGEFEIIIIDDGSTDGSVAICTAVAQKDSRIRIIKGAHQGVSAARNLGIDAARGDYLLFVDSDDVIHPRMMEVMLENMERTNAAMAGPMRLFLPQQKWDMGKEKIFHSEKPAEFTVQNNTEALRDVFESNSPISVIGGVMLQKNILGKTRFLTELSIGEDFYFLYENLIKGSDVFYLQRKWYLVRLHDTNTSWDYTYHGFWSRFHRRELVWQSEERLGRQKYANGQKVEAYAVYRKCVKKAGVFSRDGKKMRKTLKEYRKTIAPAVKGKTKIMFYISLYFPLLETVLNHAN